MRSLTIDNETTGVNALWAPTGVVMVFGYKWSDESVTRSLSINDFPHWYDSKTGLYEGDKGIVLEAMKIVRQARIIVGHYSDKFDMPFLRSRFDHHFGKDESLEYLKHLPRQYDTWKLAWKLYREQSKRLGALAKFHNLSEQKYEKRGDEWPRWWFEALNGYEPVFKHIAAYCRQDVRTAEALFHQERKWRKRR